MATTTQRVYNFRAHPKSSIKLADYDQQLKDDVFDSERSKHYHSRKRSRQLDTTSLSAAAISSKKRRNQNSSISTQCSLETSEMQLSSTGSADAVSCNSNACAVAPTALDTSAGPAQSQPKSTKSAAVNKAGRSCSNCGTCESAGNTWRKGPDGLRNLCNACGLKYSRQGAAALKAQSTAARQQMTSSVSSGSSSSTQIVAVSSPPTTAAPQSCEGTNISRSSSCLSAVTGESKPCGKMLRQTTLQQQPQQTQELRRSSRQQQKRNRQQADLLIVAEQNIFTAAAGAEAKSKRRKANRGQQVQVDCKAEAQTIRSVAAVADVLDLMEAVDVLLGLASSCGLEHVTSGVTVGPIG